MTLQAPKLATETAAARVRRRRLRRSTRWPCSTAERCAPAIAIAVFPALTFGVLVSALPDCHAELGMSRTKFSYSDGLTGSPHPALPRRRGRGKLGACGGAVDDELELAVERLDVARRERRIASQHPRQGLAFGGPLHHEKHRASGVEHWQRQGESIRRWLGGVVHMGDQRLRLVKNRATGKQRSRVAILPQTQMDQVKPRAAAGVRRNPAQGGCRVP